MMTAQRIKIIDLVELGQFDKIEKLINSCSTPAEKKELVNQCSETGRSAVFAAIESNDLSILKLLIDAGANLEFRDDFGCTPLSLAEGKDKCSPEKNSYNEIITLIKKNLLAHEKKEAIKKSDYSDDYIISFLKKGKKEKKTKEGNIKARKRKCETNNENEKDSNKDSKTQPLTSEASTTLSSTSSFSGLSVLSSSTSSSSTSQLPPFVELQVQGGGDVQKNVKSRGK